MATLPVWRDYALNFGGDGTYTAYAVSDYSTNNVLFRGRAYPYPGDMTASVFINRIVRDFITAKVEWSEDTVSMQPKWKRTFSISSGGIPRLLTFHADWSHDPSSTPSGLASTSAPISHIVDPRQYLLTSVGYYGDGDFILPIAVYATKNGSTTTVGSIGTRGVAATFRLPMAAYEGSDIEVRDIFGVLQTYKVESTCAQYCLYYLNAHGGFDSLLIMGNALRTDNYARTEITREANNSTPTFGRQQMLNEITAKWKLYTDYLTDEQWALTPQLLGSPQVYLHDFETNEVVPVVITQNAAEYRTYANQGKKKTYLTIECEASQKEWRM